jgi:hypothetical protein
MRLHSRWRPAPPSTTVHEPLVPDMAPVDPTLGAHAAGEPVVRSGRKLTLIGIVALILAATVAGQQSARRASSQPQLPSTPTQWVDQWISATLQHPARVCGQLYAPALAAVFKADTGHSCAWYYSSVKSTSFRIRHVLQAGGTAVVESQQLDAGRLGYFTTILNHTRNGWQAVDMVPGGPVRPR